MAKIGLWIVVMVLGLGTLSAQSDSLPVNNRFAFRDGLYRTFSDFQQNHPVWKWEEIAATLTVNAQTSIAQVETLRLRNNNSSLLDSIWGFAYEGQPFIRIPMDSTRRAVAIFAGFTIKGAICLYSYERQVTDTLEMKAYNPLTGKPFRRGTIKRSSRILQEKIMRFADGLTRPFTREEVLAWVERDAELRRAIPLIEGDELGEKLRRALVVFNERYPVRVPR